MIIITQEDYFFIPTNIEKIITRFGPSRVDMIIQIDSKGSINNKKKLFFFGFGMFQSLKYGKAVLHKKTRIFFSKFFKQIDDRIDSIQSIADFHNIPFIRTYNINGSDIIEKLKKLNPEIIISFSAPTVFKETILNLPKFGCINLHCSLLPSYAGLFPSFWVLNNKEEFTGCTVHKMDDKIDNGIILKQKIVTINEYETIFSLLSKTKLEGGNLMVDAIESIFNGTIQYKENKLNEGSYYTWPTLNELRKFRRNGGRLI